MHAKMCCIQFQCGETGQENHTNGVMFFLVFCVSIFSGYHVLLATKPHLDHMLCKVRERKCGTKDGLMIKFFINKSCLKT